MSYCACRRTCSSLPLHHAQPPTHPHLTRKQVGNNLKYWGNNEEVVGSTLGLLLEMTQGCGSAKVLLTFDTIQYILQHHTPGMPFPTHPPTYSIHHLSPSISLTHPPIQTEHFPFLSLPANSRHRTSFHTTLARLILSVLDENMTITFEAFMEPILQVLGQLNNTADLRSEEAKQATIGACRDLRGRYMGGWVDGWMDR